jgi:Holliday junction resolvase RusA-like endonuclease
MIERVVQSDAPALKRKCIQFKLNDLGVSVNAMYYTDRQGKRRKSYTALKKTKAIQLATRGRGFFTKETYLRMYLTFFTPCFNKSNGKIKTWDCSNRIKMIEDAIVTQLGVDDRQIFEVIVKKLHLQDEKPFTYVRVEEMFDWETEAELNDDSVRPIFGGQVPHETRDDPLRALPHNYRIDAEPNLGHVLELDPELEVSNLGTAKRNHEARRYGYEPEKN